jgi:hypothetical protein
MDGNTYLAVLAKEWAKTTLKDVGVFVNWNLMNGQPKDLVGTSSSV